MHKEKLLILIAVLIAVGLFLYWYLALRPLKPPVVEPPIGKAIESPDLGSELFEKASNPVSGRLPDTVAPIPSPLGGAYQNPFE